MKDRAVSYLDNFLQQIEDNAVDVLGEIGEPSVECLCHALGHSEGIVRASAAYALGGIGCTMAIDALCRTLGDSDINVRLSAARALAKIGEPAVEPLCKALAHGSKEVRWMASGALGEIGDATTLPRKVITCPGMTVANRVSALRIVAKVSAYRSIGSVRECAEHLLSDSDPAVCEGARAILTYFTEKPEEMLRPSERDPDNIGKTLLHPTIGVASASEDHLLRPVENEPP